MTVDAAAKKALRLSLKGWIKLVIDDKVVASAHYQNQQHRKTKVGEWYTEFFLAERNYELIISPTT
jgi:acylphosphatase